MAIICRCVTKIVDKHGKITDYELADLYDRRKVISADSLKKAMRSNELIVSNLTLTSDNRLMSKADEAFNTQNGYKHAIRVRKPSPVETTKLIKEIDCVRDLLKRVDQFVVPQYANEDENNKNNPNWRPFTKIDTRWEQNNTDGPYVRIEVFDSQQLIGYQRLVLKLGPRYGIQLTSYGFDYKLSKTGKVLYKEKYKDSAATTSCVSLHDTYLATLKEYMVITPEERKQILKIWVDYVKNYYKQPEIVQVQVKEKESQIVISSTIAKTKRHVVTIQLLPDSDRVEITDVWFKLTPTDDSNQQFTKTKIQEEKHRLTLKPYRFRGDMSYDKQIDTLLQFFVNSTDY